MLQYSDSDSLTHSLLWYSGSLGIGLTEGTRVNALQPGGAGERRAKRVKTWKREKCETCKKCEKNVLWLYFDLIWLDLICKKIQSVFYRFFVCTAKYSSTSTHLTILCHTIPYLTASIPTMDTRGESWGGSGWRDRERAVEAGRRLAGTYVGQSHEGTCR